MFNPNELSQDMIVLAERIYLQSHPAEADIIARYNGRITDSEKVEDQKIRQAYKYRLVVDLFDLIDTMNIDEIKNEQTRTAGDMIEEAIEASKEEVQSLEDEYSAGEAAQWEYEHDTYDYHDIINKFVAKIPINGTKVARTLHGNDPMVMITIGGKVPNTEYRIILKYKNETIELVKFIFDHIIRAANEHQFADEVLGEVFRISEYFENPDVVVKKL